MYTLSLIFCLFFFPALSAIEFKEEIKKAEVGDFLVYSYKEQDSLLRIAKNSGKELVIEEISVPKQAIHSMPSWQAWLTAHAPGHTSWTITQINPENGEITSIFSVDDNNFVSSNPAFQFLPTLFKLTFKQVGRDERKYIGAKPMEGEIDMRRLWLPKIIFEGREQHPKIEVFEVIWPHDESELSEKHLDLYFSQNEGITYLPYWIEIRAMLGKAKISAIDSGKKLSSPAKF